MNDLQKRYIATKAYSDTMLEHGTDAEFDAAADAMLDSEAELVEWALAQAEPHMPAADMQALRRNWFKPKFNERMIDLAMRLDAK